MGLQQYRSKRNFRETPEPRGTAQSPSARNRSSSFNNMLRAVSIMTFDWNWMGR
jgi:hypothetical protein